MVMNDTPLPPTPPPPQVPPLGPLLLQLILGMISSPWLRAFITALLSSLGTVQLMQTPGCCPVQPAPPPPKPPVEPPVIPKPADAIGRITFGNSGCTATIIGPVGFADAKLHILTAAHCVRIGDSGVMTLKDGRKLGVTCVSRDAGSDAAWLTAIRPQGAVPFLLLADANPAEGEAVWHQGYGIDKPNNRESGKFLGVIGNGQQCRFRLSVSPGDSGGGIILDASSKVISPVCCTTRLSGVGEVFGSTPAYAARIRPKTTAADAARPWLIHPMEHPVFREKIFPEPPPLG